MRKLILVFLNTFSFFLSLAASCSTWNLSSLARDRTHAPCIGSAESELLDHQGIPRMFLISLYTFCFCLFSFQKLLEASLRFEFHIHTSRFGSICTDCVEIQQALSMRRFCSLTLGICFYYFLGNFLPPILSVFLLQDSLLVRC